MALMGLDIGTTGCKCAVFTEDGRQLSYQYQEYQRDIGSSEIDGAAIWDYFQQMIPAAVQESRADITAIAVTSCGEAIAPIGKNGIPLHPFFQSIDTRGNRYIDRFSQDIKERIRRVTGLQPLPRYSLSKLAYLRSERQDIFRQAWKYMCLEDYILYCLTGRAVTDYTVSTRTAAFNIYTKSFEPEILEAAGIRTDQMCECVPAGAAVGYIRPSLAAPLKLSTGTLAVAGGHDSIPEALCSGLLSPQAAVLGCGTAEGLSVLIPSDTSHGNELLRYNFNREPYPIPEYHLSFGVNANSGNLIKWFRDILGTDALAQSRQTGENPYQILDRTVSPGPTGLLAVPHFVGSSSPDFVKEARGTIAGLRLSTTKGDIYKSLIEGDGYELAYIMEKFSGCGISMGEIRASGGGAKSNVQLQIKADILGTPLIPMQTKDTTVAGCAMMAGTASGVYDSYRQAAEYYVKMGPAIEPVPAHHRRYRELYGSYRALRAAMLNFWTQTNHP